MEQTLENKNKTIVLEAVAMSIRVASKQFRLTTYVARECRRSSNRPRSAGMYVRYRHDCLRAQRIFLARWLGLVD